MTDRNIQIRNKVGDSWDNLYPLTLSGNVFDENGQSVKSQISDQDNSNNFIRGNSMEENDFTNGIWSWWIYPLAQYRNGKTFFGHTDDTGTVSINSYSHIDGSLEKTSLISEEVDDHNAPCILFLRDGRPVVFYSRHNKDNYLRYRVGTKENSITDLGAEQTIELPGRVTYAQGHVDTSGRIHIFTRVGSYSWHYLRLDREATTIERNRQLFSFGSGNQGYIKIKHSDKAFTTEVIPGIIRIALSGHPTIGNFHDIKYCYMILETGEINLPGDVTVGNAWTGDNLPLNVSSLQDVYTASGSKKARLFDIGSDSLEVVFAEFTDNNDGDYKYASWQGNGFSIKPIIKAGMPIGGGESRQYFGGGYIPNSKSGEILLSREEDGAWYIEKWITNNSGTDWQVQLIDKSIHEKLFRPVSPLNASDDIFYMKGEYSEVNFTDYATDISYKSSNLHALNHKVETYKPPFIQRSGGVARVPTRVDIGRVTGTLRITFPKPYPSVPDVMITPHITQYNVGMSNLDETGFNIDVRVLSEELTRDEVPVRWVAFGEYPD